MNNYFSAASSKDESPRQRQENQYEQERRDARLDEALGFTFPASDPVAVNCSVTPFLAPQRDQVRADIDFFKQASAHASP